jgi:hypothetical protein
MGLVRQLLIDGGRLIDLVNRNLRIRLRFPVAEVRAIDRGATDIVIRGFGGTATPTYTNLSGFLGYQCISIHGQAFTVADVILIAANKQGGVHFDGDPESREAALINLRFQNHGVELFGGYGPGSDGIALMAHQIGLATLEGLAPLDEAVRSELGGQAD